jgi:hypothetical protein
LVATAALAATTLLFAVLDRDAAGNAIGGRAAPAKPREVKVRQAEVTITSRARMIRVPDSFLGLSTEYWALLPFERRMSLFERVLSLLHVQGDGPLILRVGGDSADHTFWDPSARRTPAWVFGLTPAWLRQTSILVDRARLRLILDLNLVTASPSSAAQWAHAAQTRLPHASIAGFEIGNEPDIYSRSYWRASISRTTPDTSFLPSAISARSYTQDFQSYALALARAAPGVPLIGPAIASPAHDGNWISSLLAGPHAGLGIVSAHRYPFSACVPRTSPSYPTIARLLSEQASAGLAQTVRPAVRVAHNAGRPFRLTELNSVTCGGLPGVSDRFATALWAPDALFELLLAGVDGVNIHVRANAINAAFTLNRRGLHARPLLYGLHLFASMLGRDAQLVDLRLRTRRSLHLKVWAVRAHGGVLRVLLIDKGNHPVNVDLHLPATGPAIVERLLAPSARSDSGVTLDGQHLGSDGRWHGRPAKQTLTHHKHGYDLTVPKLSAALLSVHLYPGALTLNTVTNRAPDVTARTRGSSARG